MLECNQDMSQFICGTFPEYLESVSCICAPFCEAVAVCTVYAYARASCCLIRNAGMTLTKLQVTKLIRSILMLHTGLQQLLCANHITVLIDKVHSDVTHRDVLHLLCHSQYCND